MLAKSVEVDFGLANICPHVPRVFRIGDNVRIPTELPRTELAARCYHSIRIVPKPAVQDVSQLGNGIGNAVHRLLGGCDPEVGETACTCEAVMEIASAASLQ